MDELGRILDRGNSAFKLKVKSRCEANPSNIEGFTRDVPISPSSTQEIRSSEEPNVFLQLRPLISPLVIVCEANCILAIGAVPVLTFPKEDVNESVTHLLGCFYTFHFTYLKCISTLLSVLQTEVLLDAIHERNMTTSYKKSNC